MGKLTIENESLAAWMTINNTFTATLRGLSDVPDFDREKYYWNGVMIQLGYYRDFRVDQRPIAFAALTINDGNKELRLSREEFEQHTTWINLIPTILPEIENKAGGTKEPPMRRADQSELFKDDKSSIHKHLEPFAGGITIWPADQLTITIQRHEGTGHEYVHRTHVFEWNGSMRALVYQDGDDKPRHDIPGVLAITIEEGDGLPDGIHQDPPQRP